MDANTQMTFSNAFSWMKMLQFWLKFIWDLFQKGSINNIPPLVQIMARRRRDDKQLSETSMVSLLTHICVSRPQWVNTVVHVSAAGNCHLCHVLIELFTAKQITNTLTDNDVCLLARLPLTHYGLRHTASWNLIRLGLGNVLMHNSTKSLPEPLSTNHSEVFWYSPEGNFAG